MFQMGSKPTAILLISCPDQRGLVARIAEFVFRHNGNIIHSDHHTDAESGRFLMRVEWELEGFDLTEDKIAGAFAPVAESLQMQWQLRLSDRLQRVAILVSRYGHCLQDLVFRSHAGELPGQLQLVLSNHPELGPVAERFGVPFYHFPLTAESKREQEGRELELLAENGVDLIVLARYMQILSPEFVAHYPNRIINIHHSFLPAFAGSRPYHQAHERGVKLIGATSHYVTGELDEGPIIEQDVVRISHRDTVEDLVRKGRDLERIVLARAVRLHLEHRILAYGNKTVVFD